VWDAVVKHYNQKSQLILVELCCKLQNEKCDEKADMCAHLAKLQQMCNNLALTGEVLLDYSRTNFIWHLGEKYQHGGCGA
jgi:hypothetical protein